MTRLEERFVTRLDRERAFAYVADWTHQSEWDPNTVRSSRVDGGPLAVGSRFELLVRVGRSTRPMRYAITELQAGRRVVLEGAGPGIRARDTITCTDSGSGTLLGYAADIELAGILRLVQPLLRPLFRGIARGAASGLQRELDRRAQPAETP